MLLKHQVVAAPLRRDPLLVHDPLKRDDFGNTIRGPHHTSYKAYAPALQQASRPYYILNKKPNHFTNLPFFSCFSFITAVSCKQPARQIPRSQLKLNLPLFRQTVSAISYHLLKSTLTVHCTLQPLRAPTVTLTSNGFPK